MIIPIRVYGDPVLRRVTEDVASDSEQLQRFIDDMIDTMHGAGGVGLAAPQVGSTKRIFVADVRPLHEDVDDVPDGQSMFVAGPVVFINPEIVYESEDLSEFEEGCLSIPDVREMVVRPERIGMRFLDRHFEPREVEVDAVPSRVIQHEMDHLEGILFIDHIGPLRRRLLRRRLREMAQGGRTSRLPLAHASEVTSRAQATCTC